MFWTSYTHIYICLLPPMVVGQGSSPHTHCHNSKLFIHRSLWINELQLPLAFAAVGSQFLINYQGADERSR